MNVTEKLLTVEEFAAQYEGRAYELVAGIPVPVYYDENGKACDIAPTGGRHQIMVVEIAHHLREYARNVQAGIVLAGEGGILIQRDPDTHRAFDAAYVSHKNIPESGVPSGYWETPLDLIVEVISPGNRAGDMRTKVAEYLKIGVKMVWLLYPDSYLVDVYRSQQPTVTLQRGDTLSGDDVLPGFRLEIDTLFDPLIALDSHD